MRSVGYVQNTKPDTSSSISPGLWGNLPLEDWLLGYTGNFWFDDFNNLAKYAPNTLIQNQSGYGVFGTNLGTLQASALAADGYGAAIFTPNQASAGELYAGPQAGIGYLCTTPTNATPPIGQTFAFEARIKPSTITATNLGFAVGLGDPGLAITTGSLTATATDIISTGNFIGFRSKASVGNTLDAIYQAASQTQQTQIAGAATLVAATYVKVGFRFDPNATAAKMLRFFVNGVEQTALSNYVTAANIAAVTFPSSALLLPLVLTKLGAGAAGNLTVDWIAFGQSRSPLP